MTFFPFRINWFAVYLAQDIEKLNDEDIEKLNDEKDLTIKFLSERVVKLELTLEKLNSNENEEVQNCAKMVPCELCDFFAKNEIGLKLHMKSKHEITKVELTFFAKPRRSI